LGLLLAVGDAPLLFEFALGLLHAALGLSDDEIEVVLVALAFDGGRCGRLLSRRRHPAGQRPGHHDADEWFRTRAHLTGLR